MNNSRKTLQLARMFYREFSKTTPVASNTTEVVGPKFQRLKELQKKFGVEDDIPVYIKGGLGDKMLYSLTLAVTFVGLGLSLEVFYKLTFKDS